MMKNLKTYNGYIQIQFKKKPERITTSAGIIYDVKDKDLTEEGVVVHSGESDFAVGTCVLFKSYFMETLKQEEGDDLFFIKMEHVIAAYEPEK